MVYARIANRTVAEEYFAVAEKVEALYDAPKTLPAGAEGTEMRKLRAEMHQRMLGNGYCARPVGLDCHFESICESCTFFQTTIEFRPTLQAQRDDAAAQRPGRPEENLRRAARPAPGERLMTSQPLRLTEPGELPAPRTDADSAAVLAQAIDTLAALRTPYWLGDSAVGLHALASLIAQAHTMIPGAVHAARDQGHTWAEIGQLLNLSPAAAARRYRTTT